MIVEINKKNKVKVGFISISPRSSVKDMTQYVLNFLSKDKQGSKLYGFYPVTWKTDHWFFQKTMMGIWIIFSRNGELKKAKKKK
jgi:hypothetical protein